MEVLKDTVYQFLFQRMIKETVKAINNAVDAAIEEGIAKFGGKKPNKATIKLPLRDGDTEREDEAYAGHWFINANSKTAPQIVDKAVKPILDRDEVYSGRYARVSLNFMRSTLMVIRALPVVLATFRRSEMVSHLEEEHQQ